MDPNEQKQPQSGSTAEYGGEASASRPSRNTTRTSGSDGRFCRVCSGPITGRRRNNFCSDRCRLRASREAKQERRTRLFADLERVVGALRAELLADSDCGDDGEGQE